MVAALGRSLLALLLGLAAAQARAATLAVVTADDSGAGSLRNTIASAESGDTIIFLSGLAGATITLTTGEILIDKDLTIQGLGADSLTVSGGGNSRVFNIAASAVVTISDLALANGLATPPTPQGGAIRNAGTLTLTDCRIVGNAVPSGSSSRIGGGVVNAAVGGSNAELVIERCSVTGNVSAGEGGGIGNVTYDDGFARLTVRDSTISGNSAGYGGGVATYAQSGGSATTRIENSTLSGNDATNAGGAFDVDVLGTGVAARLVLEHATIHANQTDGNGGGLSVFDGASSVTFQNSVLAGNSAAGTGPDLYRGTAGSDLSFGGGNVLGNADGGGYLPLTGDDLAGTTANPIDPALGPLQDNGGATHTHRPNPASPLIDQAVAAHCPDADQRGEGRPFDGDNDGEASCDAGSVESRVPLHGVGGTVTGLSGGGLALVNNGSDLLEIAANGSFQFSTSLPTGESYEVVVASQPVDPNQVCSVVNGTGTVEGSDVSDIQVECVTEEYAVGGTVSGLQGAGLVLRINGGGDLAIASDGSFVFAQALPDGSGYTVAVASHPVGPAQHCSVSKGTGSISGGPVDDIQVSCETREFTIGGNLSGLAGDSVVLQNNGQDSLFLTSDGAFSFSRALPDGSGYHVTVASHPSDPDQQCSVANATGSLGGSDVVDVSVQCTTQHYAIGGMVTGLSGNGLIVQLNGSDELAISSDGAFTFPRSLPDGSSYSVTLLSQPDDSLQRCSVIGGSGTVSGGDVDSVWIACESLEPEVFADSFEVE